MICIFKLYRYFLLLTKFSITITELKYLYFHEFN